VSAIGKFRHRLTLVEPDETPDGMGGVARTWNSLGEVWAAIEPVSANDMVAADRRLGRITHRVTIRRRSEITLAHRLLLGQRVFVLLAVRDADEQGRFLECLVEEERP
jgi:SPP1 family predicted phage head-tail adaptor